MKQTKGLNEIDSGNKKRRESDAPAKQSMTSSFISVLSGMKLGFRSRTTSRASEADSAPPTSPAPARSKVIVQDRKKSVVPNSPTPNSPNRKSISKPTEPKVQVPTSSPSPSEISVAKLPSTSSHESSSELSPPSPSSALQLDAGHSPQSPSPQSTQVFTTESEEIPPLDDPKEEIHETTDESILSSGTKESLPTNGPTGGITTKNQEYFKKMREVSVSPMRLLLIFS
jgi:hypothetical protein